MTIINSKTNSHSFFPESSQAVKHGGCFSGESTIQTSLGETKRLSDLHVGESILTVDQTTGQLEYSEVILFLDRNTEERREFLRISTTSGRTLTLTPSHMLLRGNITSIETIFAERLNLNDVILVQENNTLVQDTVNRIEPILKTGVYAPLTKTGTILVNEIAASCYAVVDSQDIAHWSFAPVRVILNIQEGFGRFWHIVGKPIAGWDISSYRPNFVPTNGEYWYAKMLYRVAKNIIPKHLNDD